jgi:hypothetical protein
VGDIKCILYEEDSQKIITAGGLEGIYIWDFKNLALFLENNDIACGVISVEDKEN